MNTATVRKIVAENNAELLKAVKALLADAKPTGAKPVKAAKVKAKAVKAGTPEWLKVKGANSAKRRQIAAEMRSRGVEPRGAVWTKAMKAAGLPH